MDLEEWWGEDGEPMPVVNEIPLEDLVRQHRVRYIVRTAKGDLVLKFIGGLARRTVELNLLAANPQYNNQRKQLRELLGMVKQYPDAPQFRADMNRLRAILEPTFYEYFAACFVPRRTAEEVQAIEDALGPAEWNILTTLLIQLISASPGGQVASAMVMLCAKYGVRIADDLTLENMTAQQLAVLDQTAGDEGNAIMGVMSHG